MLPSMIYIYYGSEMGTGQEFAETLGTDLEKLGIHNTVQDIDDCDEDEIVNQELCIFFFSTYGNGQPTRSSRYFFSWMKSHCGDNMFMTKVKYAMFGLGDHNYPRYQAASILADQMLQKMGATPILELRKGDAAENIDADFEAWEKDLIEKLQSMYFVSLTNISLLVLCFSLYMIILNYDYFRFCQRFVIDYRSCLRLPKEIFQYNHSLHLLSFFCWMVITC